MDLSKPPSSLPPNPYTRQAVRKISMLADRLAEQQKLEYYFNLTAAGQNPHLALIGDRGVGKTSLLNAAEAIAQQKKLLPVGIDLNESKVVSQGRFWKDLYSSLIEQIADT